MALSGCIKGQAGPVSLEKASSSMLVFAPDPFACSSARLIMNSILWVCTWTG
jgi:hypothetical protein